MNFVDKNELVSITRLRKDELDYLISNYISIRYSKGERKRTYYSLDVVVEALKTEKTKKYLGIASTRELYDICVERGIFSGKNKKDFNKMSDKLTKSDSHETYSINITLKHSEGEGRKLNHSLYRIEDSINFLTLIPETKIQVLEAPKRVTNKTDLDVDNALLKLENEELKSQILRMKRHQEDMSIVEKDLKNENNSSYTMNKGLQGQKRRNDINTRTKLDAEMTRRLKFLIEREGKMSKKFKGKQVDFILSMKHQIETGKALEAEEAGFRIINDFYCAETGESRYEN